MTLKTAAVLIAVLAALPGPASAAPRGRPMDPASSGKLFALLQAIEGALPATSDKLETLLGVRFSEERDANGRRLLVAGPSVAGGVKIAGVHFRPLQGAHLGDLVLALDGARVGEDELARRFEGGSWVPPPPPGWGPPDAGPAYCVDRPWGRCWFAFTRDGALRRVTFEFGVHGYPGI